LSGPDDSSQRILHVDPDPAHRRALREITLNTPYELVGEVIHPDGVLPQYLHLQPDFVILDAGIGKKTGGIWSGGVIRLIRKENPWARIVVSYEPAEAGLVFDALRLGAVEYMRKPFNLFRMMDCLINARIATSSGSNSRRQLGRLRAGLSVSYQVIQDRWLDRVRNRTPHYRSRTVDISMAGVCLILREPGISAGDLLRLSIDVQPDQPLCCKGLVRYVQRDQNRTVGGVQFLKLKEPQLKLLQRALINLLCRDHGH